MPLKKLFIAIFLMFSLLTPAQATHSVRYPTFKVDGTMKNKFEYASETGSYRFSVRNSRMGEKCTRFRFPLSLAHTTETRLTLRSGAKNCRAASVSNSVV